MEVFLNDFGSYAFIAQLARELSGRFNKMHYSYCASHTTTPQGTGCLEGRADESLRVMPIHLRQPLDKYSLLKRRSQELEYGRLSAAAFKQSRSQTVLSANMPLDGQAVLWKQARKLGSKRIYWLQDIIGLATTGVLRKRLGPIGKWIGAYYGSLERSLLKDSDCVVAISDSFRDYLLKIGVSREKIVVRPNWAPIEEIPVLSKNNEWSRSRGLEDKFVFLYSGTLSLKHNPQHLLRLAESLIGTSALVLVKSQGKGAEWLRENMRPELEGHMIIEGFADYSDLPSVYGASDVLVALLELEAAQYSVPSKVLSYLCAERPLLCAIPNGNDAAKIVSESRSGFTTEPGDYKRFLLAAKQLMLNELTRLEMAENARAYASRNFEVAEITNDFASLLSRP